MIDDSETIGSKSNNGSADNALSNIYTGILFDLGINQNRFNILLERYLTVANIPNNLKEISTFRGNIKKELLKNTMSWKVFIKGLVFLNVTSFTITIKLNHASGRNSLHSKTINLSINDVEEPVDEQ